MVRDTLAYEAPPASGSAGSSCAFCESLRDGESEFAAGTINRPESIEFAAESIADALGFCGQHGVLLADQRNNEFTLMRTLRCATVRLIELLTDEKRNAERLLELFFAAERTCVTCRLVDHQFAHLTHQIVTRLESGPDSTTLCFPHYRAVASAVTAQTLQGLVGPQLTLLETVVALVGPVARGPHARTSHRSLDPEALHWALDVVAGGAGPMHGGSVVPVPDFELVCPVCAEIVRAGERWAEAAHTAARLGQDLWTVFPTCPTHILYCATTGDERVAALAVRYAADVQLAALRRGQAAVARHNAQRDAASKSAFYRRQSPAYVLGQQRKMVTAMPRCPACERLIVARDRALGGIVQKLRAGRGHSEEVGAPCLKHFAAIYVLVPQGAARAALLAGQLARLEALDGTLAEAGDGAGTVRPAAARAAITEAMRLWSAATPPLSGRS